MEFLGHMSKDRIIFVFVSLFTCLAALTCELQWSKNIQQPYKYTRMSTCTQCSRTHTHIHTHAVAHALRLILTLDIFCPGVYQRTRCYRTPLWVPLSSPEQLMTPGSQKLWPQNGCLSGMEVSHHPDNQVKPSEYHQCAQQSQGSEFTPPRDPSVELICCSGNRILVLHDSDSSQTLRTFSVSNDWLDDSWQSDTTIRFHGHEGAAAELG